MRHFSSSCSFRCPLVDVVAPPPPVLVRVSTFYVDFAIPTDDLPPPLKDGDGLMAVDGGQESCRRKRNSLVEIGSLTSSTVPLPATCRKIFVGWLP